MKSYLILSIILVCLHGIHAKNPQIKDASNYPVFMPQLESYFDGVYYFNDGFYYNTTSGDLFPSNQTTAKCTPSFTLDVEPFCINQVLDSKTRELVFTLVFLTPNLTNVSATYQIARLPESSSIYFQVVQDYIVIGLFGLNKGTFMIKLFELSTSTFVCTTPEFKDRFLLDFEYLYSNGSIFVYSVIDTSNQSSYFVTGFCSSNQTTISPGPNMVQNIGILAFNDSQVFVNYFGSAERSIQENFVQVGAYNSSNQLNFGPGMSVHNFEAYNDTHMLITFVHHNIQTFGLFVVDSYLEFVQVASFNFGLNVPISATPVIGKNQALLNLGDQVAVTFDFNSNTMVQVTTLNLPIYLANGSVVNTSRYGYFIQSPGEPIYFIQAPSSSTSGGYQDPSDLNQTYTLFVPSLNYSQISSCLLTHFNASSSIITQTTLPSCPLSLTTGNPINIKDVKFASDGTPYVCYRDTYGSLFIVNTAGSVGPLLAFYPYVFLQVSMNLTNGTANFAGTQLYYVVLGRFNITNGAVLSTTNIVAGSFYNVVTKITDRYYLVTFTGSNNNLAIYDMNLFNKTYQADTEDDTFITSLNTFIAYGFSEENPSYFSGFVFVADEFIYAVNYAGYTDMIIVPKGSSFNDAAYFNETSFVVSQNPNGVLYYIKTFEIASWENSSDDSEDQYEAYEY